MTIPRLVLPLGFALAAMGPVVTSAQNAPPADASRRVVVTAPSATAYSCAAVTCRVVTELDKGVVVAVVKTDGGWHQVLVRTSANAMTTGWVKSGQVAATDDTTVRTGNDRTDGVFRPVTPEPAPASATDAVAPAVDETPDPRGCLTCLASRQPTPDEWHAAIADTATKKAPPATATRVTPGLADGRTSEERMRDVFAQRYDLELKRLANVAANVDVDLQSYLAACFQRFGSIPVEGAPPRATRVDDILKAARSTPGAARFALWSGTAAFQWNPTWAPQPNDSSPQPSCERLWEDVRGRADGLKIDLEYLERDARDHDIYPGIVREMLAARGLAEGPAGMPAPPVTTIR
ncbi:MAG: hypothetical protein ABIT71_13980 [Vicinamibacteraceae bacterium]